MKVISFLVLFLYNGISDVRAERYVLPSEIKSLVSQIVLNFNKLEQNMITRHRVLKQKKSLTEAEFEELNAYEQILYNNYDFLMLPLNEKYPWFGNLKPI